MRFVENHIDFAHFEQYYLKLQLKKDCLYGPNVIICAQYKP
jgi:hypothetical protein